MPMASIGMVIVGRRRSSRTVPRYILHRDGRDSGWTNKAGMAPNEVEKSNTLSKTQFAAALRCAEM
jgi:hypothetical protein